MEPCRLRQPGAPAVVAGAPIRIFDPRLAEVLPVGSPLLVLYDQAIWSESPVWWSARSLLAWSDIEGRRVLSWREDGAVEVFVDATHFINGNTVDGQDRLVHCEHGRRGLSRTEADGTTEMIVTHFEGRRLNSPNDIVTAADGAIWFSDPTFGIDKPQQGCPATPDLDHRSVYRFEPASGTLTRMADLEEPNGLAFSPDEKILYVSDTPADLHRHEILAFDVVGSELRNRRSFAVVSPGMPDGFCVDKRGWVWTSSDSGVQVFAADGTPLGELPTPHFCSNCTFGGADGRRLFITGAESLWCVDLQD